MIKGGFVYIMTNKSKSTLYVGVTSNLKRRVYEHKNHLIKGSFSDRYNLEYLVYYEFFYSIEEAIKMEKKLKGGSRRKKEELINKFNPEWRDLYEEILEW
jgi:putative endonuclease